MNLFPVFAEASWNRKSEVKAVLPTHWKKKICSPAGISFGADGNRLYSGTIYRFLFVLESVRNRTPCSSFMSHSRRIHFDGLAENKWSDSELFYCVVKCWKCCLNKGATLQPPTLSRCKWHWRRTKEDYCKNFLRWLLICSIYNWRNTRKLFMNRHVKFCIGLYWFTLSVCIVERFNERIFYKETINSVTSFNFRFWNVITAVFCSPPVHWGVLFRHKCWCFVHPCAKSRNEICLNYYSPLPRPSESWLCFCGGEGGCTCYNFIRPYVWVLLNFLSPVGNVTFVFTYSLNEHKSEGTIGR